MPFITAEEVRKFARLCTDVVKLSSSECSLSLDSSDNQLTALYSLQVQKNTS